MIYPGPESSAGVQTEKKEWFTEFLKIRVSIGCAIVIWIPGSKQAMSKKKVFEVFNGENFHRSAAQ